MNKYVISFLAAFSFISSSCVKEKLPSVTQVGANTFGCKINGKTWIPNGTHDLFVSAPALTVSLYQSSQGVKWLDISARKDPSLFNTEEDAYDDMYLSIALPVSAINLTIIKNCGACDLYCPYSSMRFKIKGLYSGGCYATDSLHIGVIHFSRIDTINRIISGSFEFIGIDRNSGKTISVTDGRFDITAR